MHAWLQYDMQFRLKIAVNPAMTWDQVDHSLIATWLSADATRTKRSCFSCGNPSHLAPDCPFRPPRGGTPRPTYSRHSHPNAVQCRPPARATLASLALATLASPAHRTCADSGTGLRNAGVETAAPTDTPVSTAMAPIPGPQAVRLADPYHAQSHGSPLHLLVPLLLCLLYPQSLFHYPYHLSHTHPVPFPPLYLILYLTLCWLIMSLLPLPRITLFSHITGAPPPHI